MIYEKKMSFLVIPKSPKVWKKVEKKGLGYGVKTSYPHAHWAWVSQWRAFRVGVCIGSHHCLPMSQTCQKSQPDAWFSAAECQQMPKLRSWAYIMSANAQKKLRPKYYETFVRPVLEYSSSAWVPYTQRALRLYKGEQQDRLQVIMTASVVLVTCY